MKEIRKEIREYILRDVNMTLSRLGVSEPVKEKSEWIDKYNDSLHYEFESAPLRQIPMVFKKLEVDGYLVSLEIKKEDDRYYKLSQNNDIIVANFDYFYEHFDGGSNGCKIGRMIYSVKKNLPKSFESDYSDNMDDVCELYVRKIKGMEI